MKHIGIEYKMHKEHVYSLGETRFNFVHSVSYRFSQDITYKNKN